MPSRPTSRVFVLLVSALTLAATAAAVARQQPRKPAPARPNPTAPATGPAAPKRDMGKASPKPAIPARDPARDPAPPPPASSPFDDEPMPLDPDSPKPEVRAIKDTPFDPEAEKAIKPLPPGPIPDDPPPHEGAMISLPYLMNPPDHVKVDVLQALPGRPIGGDFLVRPDGTVNLNFYGEVPVAGLTVAQAKEKVVLHLRRWISDDTLGLTSEDKSGKLGTIPPGESDCVYVEVVQYNSPAYYVQGDVHTPGRYPYTGNETVLDALNYAGGLAHSADETDIRLARPARAGKPARVYRVDLAAIRDRAEAETNYQLFPGDRLIVGRNASAKATAALSRPSEPLRIVVNDIHYYALMTKALATANGGVPMTAAQREAFVKDWLDSWVKNALDADGSKLDEKALRELLLRHLEDAPAAPAPPDTPGPK